MRIIAIHLGILTLALLIGPNIGFCQFMTDVVSFNENNTWYEPWDHDCYIDSAYAGDCFEEPLFFHYTYLPEMYSFTIRIAENANFVLSDVSLENTMFGQRFSRPEIFRYDSIAHSYYASISQSLFDPPFYDDTLVHVACRLKLHLEDNSTQALLNLSNLVLMDSGGYSANSDTASLLIIMTNLNHPRGDLNFDSLLTAEDLTLLLEYIFGQGPPPQPFSLGDINRDCAIDLEDVLVLREEINEP